VRYQTVYAERIGSVAAPTAGLHLTPELLEAIRARGIELGRLELSVGWDFSPIVSDDLSEHVMHEESFDVDAALAPRLPPRARVAGR